MSTLLPMLDPFDEIKRLYFSTTRDTIERDLARALDLLTRMPSDADRDRVAGYMHGLADLRREWKGATPKARRGKNAEIAAAPPARPSGRLPGRAASDPDRARQVRDAVARFRAAIRIGSGMFRSLARIRTSLSLTRCSSVSEMATGVLGLRTSPAMTP